MNMRTVAYVGLAIAFLVFGYLALFSIGAPFFLTGVAMLAVMPWRHRPAVLWPALVAPWAFALGYVLIAPLGCTSTASAAAGEAAGPSFTTCTNVLGIDYSGEGPYNAPLLPAFAAGIAVALLAAFGVRRAVARGT